MEQLPVAKELALAFKNMKIHNFLVYLLVAYNNANGIRTFYSDWPL